MLFHTLASCHFAMLPCNEIHSIYCNDRPMLKSVPSCGVFHP